MNYSIVSQNFILDSSISATAKVMYLTLNALAEELNHIQITENQLAKTQNLSDRTVRRNIAELEEEGLICKYREGYKGVITYVIIPYEIKHKAELRTAKDLEDIIIEIHKYIDKVKEEQGVELKPKKRITKKVKTTPKKPKKEEKKKENEEYNAKDYCKYFSDMALEKKGLIIAWSNPRVMSIMKRVTKDKSKEENLHLIDTFLDIYDSKFKRVGFETPTINGFGTSWIYNIVVEYAKQRPIKAEHKESNILTDMIF